MKRLRQLLQALSLVILAGLALAPLPTPALEPPPNAHEHWSYQPLRDVQPPPVRNTNWARNDIDRFILAYLESRGVEPAPPADPRILVRRLFADFTGLPPTPDDVEGFAHAAYPTGFQSQPPRHEAVDRLIGQLLSSPGYGERWGRLWLDVARYSDTKGYVYAREERHFVHAPAYRDWVVRAFNDDMPYDRFLLLQIAADQIVEPNSPDLAALGFLTGGRRFLGVTHDIIDDRIDVVTRGALGMTVQCARCHNHKYDPIPIEDYYSLYGVFRANDVRLVPLANPDDAELAKRRKTLADGTAKRLGEANSRLRSRIAEYLTAQLELHKYPEEGFDQILTPGDVIPASVRRWRDFLLTRVSAAHPIFGPWNRFASLDESKFADAAPAVREEVRRQAGLNAQIAAMLATVPTSMRELATRYGQVFAEADKNPDAPGAAELRAFLDDPESPARVPDTGIINNEGFYTTSVTEELWKLDGDVDRRLIELGTPAALVLKDRPGEPDPRVFLRGSASRLGDPVPRRFLNVLHRGERRPFQNGSGRLELAHAITDPGNPLTARVMVNRIWQHHFGTGLVPTSSDFGLRAENPTHPELLDWLARRFIQERWSVKAMHRLIASSATYQQMSRRAPPMGTSLESDTPKPATAPLAFTPFPSRRLDFEQLRDAMLSVSGDLDSRMGGRASELLDSKNRRRTLYALVDRQFLPGTFRTFDFANPDIHVATRYETTVPQQALFFLNGKFAASRAQSLAARVDRSVPTNAPPEARIQFYYRELFQRDATPREVRLAARFVEVATADAPPPPEPVRVTPWTYGTGFFDESSRATRGFKALPHFTGSAWQGAESWPGGCTGWAQITANGGHPGDTRNHAVIRRWTAPADVTVRISGVLNHEPEAGDGVRAFVISSRHGVLVATRAHHSKTEITMDALALKTGDTVDFLVDIGNGLNSDQYLWAPVLTRIHPSPDSSSESIWDAKKDFGGPKPVQIRLSPWEQFAQVLLLSNEFAFVD